MAGIREQMGVANISFDITREKWSWPGNIMSRADNRWTFRVTEWLQGKYRESGGAMKLRNLQAQLGISYHKTGVIEDRQDRPSACSGHKNRLLLLLIMRCPFCNLMFVPRDGARRAELEIGLLIG